MVFLSVSRMIFMGQSPFHCAFACVKRCRCKYYTVISLTSQGDRVRFHGINIWYRPFARNYREITDISVIFVKIFGYFLLIIGFSMEIRSKTRIQHGICLWNSGNSCQFGDDSKKLPAIPTDWPSPDGVSFEKRNNFWYNIIRRWEKKKIQNSFLHSTSS